VALASLGAEAGEFPGLHPIKVNASSNASTCHMSSDRWFMGF